MNSNTNKPMFDKAVFVLLLNVPEQLLSCREIVNIFVVILPCTRVNNSTSKASLVMPNSDPCPGQNFLIIKPLIDSYTVT